MSENCINNKTVTVFTVSEGKCDVESENCRKRTGKMIFSHLTRD